MIYLFLKADEYLASRRIAELKREVGDPEMADLNTAQLQGNDTDAAGLLYQAGTVPFLAERRLIIVHDYLSRLDKRMYASKGTENAAYDEAAKLFRGLADLPPTCDLVFVESDLDKRRHLWRGFSQDAKEGVHAVPGLAQLIEEKQIHLEDLETPDARQLPGWIHRQAQEQEIEIEGQAIQMLANHVGTDLRRLQNELQKLAAYAAGRAITAEDVRLMVSDASEAIIWDLTDGLSQRNGGKAMRALHELRRDDASPFYLLTMMARQYRILIKVKEAIRHGGGSQYDIAGRVGESPYPVKKAMQQCRSYRMSELEDILDRLLRADYAMKSGADPETEIDILVAELTGRSDRG